jgi:hypothetical protein
MRARAPNKCERCARRSMHSRRAARYFQFSSSTLISFAHKVSFAIERTRYSLHKESEERNAHVVARSWRRTSSPSNNPPVVASREECGCKTLPKIWRVLKDRAQNSNFAPAGQSGAGPSSWFFAASVSDQAHSTFHLLFPIVGKRSIVETHTIAIVSILVVDPEIYTTVECGRRAKKGGDFWHTNSLCRKIP